MFKIAIVCVRQEQARKTIQKAGLRITRILDDLCSLIGRRNGRKVSVFDKIRKTLLKKRLRRVIRQTSKILFKQPVLAISRDGLDQSPLCSLLKIAERLCKMAQIFPSPLAEECAELVVTVVSLEIVRSFIRLFNTRQRQFLSLVVDLEQASQLISEAGLYRVDCFHPHFDELRKQASQLRDLSKQLIAIKNRKEKNHLENLVNQIFEVLDTLDKGRSNVALGQYSSAHTFYGQAYELAQEIVTNARELGLC
ncbi:MAG: hypothetical protein NZO16_04585 [Deltaproteobacteria bacterium]|nr:hypothetical protein [Deltaproteobacteria bacterium]